MALDKAAVARIATLARIKVSDEECEALAKDLSQILGLVEQLNEVDTTGVEPLAGVEEENLPVRLDAVTDGQPREELLANANAPVYCYFTVPKVIE
jgi:aspartyl-tRNA(Asn)/glutamyl-tRNA(Gln) amidotransferase subunit C